MSRAARQHLPWLSTRTAAGKGGGCWEPGAGGRGLGAGEGGARRNGHRVNNKKEIKINKILINKEEIRF